MTPTPAPTAPRYETLLIEERDSVGILTLNRPDAMNALSSTMMRELATLVDRWESDDDIRAIVLTGSERVFAAGADITEIRNLSHLDLLSGGFFDDWDCIARCRKPVIAAVAGYALGGGCELAMMCDFIIAADTARFGQPEVRIGAIPGLGGTQRLTHLIGRAKAMDLCLTGRMMEADEAERAGLVARVVPLSELQEEAFASARAIAGFSAPVVQLARECVDVASETPLQQGLQYERRAFYSLFGTDDQREGMTAFIEKRSPVFTR